jgi:hypothetical protein
LEDKIEQDRKLFEAACNETADNNMAHCEEIRFQEEKRLQIFKKE